MDLGSGHLHQLRNVTRSFGSEVGLNLFGVRLAVLARVKPSDENFVFVSSRPSSEPVYLRCAPVRLTDQRSAAPTRAGESSALASCALGPIPVCYP